MEGLPQSQRLWEVWCVFTDTALWQVRGKLTGKYGVLCRRPYCHWTAERQMQKVYVPITSWHWWKSTLQRARTIVLWSYPAQTIIQAREMKQIKGFSDFQHQSIPKMVSAPTKTWVSPEPEPRLCSLRHNAALGCGSEIRILVNKNSARTGTNEITAQRPRLCQNSGWRFCLRLSQTGWLNTCTPHRLLKRKNCERGKMVFEDKMF